MSGGWAIHFSLLYSPVYAATNVLSLMDVVALERNLDCEDEYKIHHQGRASL